MNTVVGGWEDVGREEGPLGDYDELGLFIDCREARPRRR